MTDERKSGKLIFERRARQDRATVASVEQKEARQVRCCDDIAGKELSWSVVCQDREQKLERFQHLGVCEKIDERSALRKFKVAPVDTLWGSSDGGIERRFVDPSKS